MPFAAVPPAVVVAVTLLGAAVMLAWRMRETNSAVSLVKIVAPPLGMSTGLSMFAAPMFRIPWTWGGAAFAAGALLFAVPLARTSRLVRRGDDIRMERSKAFLWILLALVAVRFALRAWIERLITPMQTGALFFLLAFGMILRWRAAMLVSYLRLRRQEP